jgi:hypothetical protein
MPAESTNNLNTRCTEALRALEREGVIKSGWLPGMRDVCGWRVIRIDGRLDGQKYLITCETERDSPDGDRQYPGEGMWNWSLTYDHDLSDLLTAASLIVPVREAYGIPTLTAVAGRESPGVFSWEITDWQENPTLAALGHFPSEVEALVAALAAKAREVPNDG